MRDLTDAELDVVGGGKRKWEKNNHAKKVDVDVNINANYQSNNVSFGDIYAKKVDIDIYQSNNNYQTIEA
jgi:hypothetical protein